MRDHFTRAPGTPSPILGMPTRERSWRDDRRPVNPRAVEMLRGVHAGLAPDRRLAFMASVSRHFGEATVSALCDPYAVADAMLESGPDV